MAAYVDLTEQYDHFRNAFLLAALALCLVISGAVGIPTIAWYRRTKEKQRADRRIRFLAHHDALTGAANRAHLSEMLDKALAALPSRGNSLAVHFIDIDRFKGVNDAFGHDGGDFLLKTFADRLRALTLLDDDVARLGGDEFIVIQTDVESKDDAEKFAHRLAAALAAADAVQQARALCDGEVGLAMRPEDGAAPSGCGKARIGLSTRPRPTDAITTAARTEMDATLQAGINSKDGRNAVATTEAR